MQVQRDMFVKTLCSLCISKETTAKQGNYSQVTFNAGVCTSNNVLATNTLADLILDLFQSKGGSSKRSKKYFESSQNQDIQLWTIILETLLRIDLVN